MSSEMFQSGSHASFRDVSLNLDWDLEDLVERLESQWIEQGTADLSRFLPPSDHPRFNEIAMELVRVDAELAINAGFPRSVGHYVSILPQLMNDVDRQQQLAFELARLSMPNAIAVKYPQTGDIVQGFELLGSLGQGAFSRVFLAAETALSRRLVVLKFSTKFPGEASTLARLQHKNIVPIYSWHKHEKFHVVCMPYLGSTTLWDFLKQYAPAESMLGQAIVSTLNMRRSKTLADAAKADPSATSVEGTVGQTETLGLSREIPKLLLGQNSHETLLWIGKELAEGLMHAHDRGVLHRDIKPANILLADDGTPMLLDFNLSVSSNAAPKTNDAGGTPRYMSPEQLRRLLQIQDTEDARSDLYSLGIVLFELATGRSPFTDSTDGGREAMRAMLDSRKNWSSYTESWPPNLPIATIDIISKLLAFAPDQRYESAHQVFEDFSHQLNHLPLRFNRNRSPAELASKWISRHPRVSSATFVGSLLGALLLVGAMLLVWRQQQVATLESEKWLVSIEKAQLPAQALMAQGSLLSNEADAVLSKLDNNLVSKGSLQKHESRLSEDQRPRARQLLGQLLTYRAHGSFEQALHESDNEQRKRRLESSLNDANAATDLLQVGKETAQSLANSLCIATSIPEANQLVSLRPSIPTEWIQEDMADVGNPWYWFMLGQRKFDAGDSSAAFASAQLAMMIDPKFVNSKYLIARIQMEAKKFVEAEKILTELINESTKLNPELYMNRAIALMALGKPSEARADLDHVIDSAHSYPRIYFLREQARRMLGDISGANEDMKAGLACQPTDAIGWASRGDAKLRSIPPDPQGALEDLKKAQSLGPELKLVYDNQAFILADMLGRRKEAIEVLDRAIENLPIYGSFYGARAVYRARQGDLASALKDIEDALQLDRSPMVCYQAASALLVGDPGGTDPSVIQRAIDLLKETLRKDPALAQMMDTDHDLDLIREDERFKNLIRSATYLR